MRYVLIALLALTCSVPKADAFRHGFNTTWSGSLFGITWACFNSMVTGCSTAFNAVCSPTGATGSDVTAANSFNTWYASQSTRVGLYIAPGSVCHVEGSANNFGWGTGAGLVIWAFGAYLSNENLGGADFYLDAVHDSRIVTVAAGSTTVTLVTPSEISRFSVGNETYIGGVSTQTFGYPPNWQFFEHKAIKAIATDCPSPCTSSVITLDGPLINSYKSTWPDLGIGDSPTPLGGPGKIYALQPQFNTYLEVFGLSLMVDVNNAAYGAGVVNSDTYFYAVTHLGGGWGLRGKNITLVNTNLPGGTEIDKNIENMTCYACYGLSGNGFAFASSSPRKLTIVNSRAVGVLNGTGQNATIINSNFASLTAGSPGYGASMNLTLSGVTYPDAHVYYQWITNADLTFSSGTFTILKSAGTIANAYATFIPGAKIYLAGVAGNSVCTPKAEFTVTDLREDATHVYIDIDQTTLPTCSGGTVGGYGQFHLLNAPTITGSGPADITTIPETSP
jgi:hypothetical protein